MKEISSRERYMAALEHRDADRPAFSWGFGPQPPTLSDLNSYLKQWGIDYEELYLRTSDERHIELQYTGPKLRANQSIWGYTTRAISYGAGHYDEFDQQPLANAESVSEIGSHGWPDPNGYDFVALREQIDVMDPNREYATILWGGNPFEILTWMMGIEKTLMFMVVKPEIILAGMQRVTDFFVTRTQMALEAASGQIDVVYCADDLGTQKGLMISPFTYRNLIKPFHEQLYSVIREYGAKVMHHSDGSVFDLLDDLIDAGVDCLEAVQVECTNMEPKKLKRDFGDRLAFRGAVSVQQILPCCTVFQVRQEVSRLKEILGKDGGYICGPSHAIQAGTPPENVVAMVEEAVEKNIGEVANA